MGGRAGSRRSADRSADEADSTPGGRAAGAPDAARTRALKALAKRLGVPWSEALGATLHQALTHASYSKENPGVPDNERLELLGDAVATLVVLQVLYHEHPSEQEGELSMRKHAMVSRKAFGQIGRELGLGPLLVLGEGARGGNVAGNESVLGGALEAVIGALSITLPWDEVRAMVVQHVVAPARRIVESGAFRDHKTLLQQACHQRRWREPVYSVVGESGPRHAPVIEVEVVLEGGARYYASAGRRRDAEQLAARQALEALQLADSGPAS